MDEKRMRREEKTLNYTGKKFNEGECIKAVFYQLILAFIKVA